MSTSPPAPAALAAALKQAATVALQGGDIDSALQRFAEARRLTPADTGLLRALAALYQHAGRPAEAWSAAETGLALQPGDAAFAAARSAAMGSAGFTDAALTLTRAALAAAPGDAALLHHLGVLLLQSGDAAGALATARMALARQPDDPALLSLAAEAAFQQGDIGAARAWLDHAVTLEPQNRDLRMARATMLLSLGDWAPGLADYEYRLLPDATRQIVRRGLDLPRWQGEDLGRRRLLVVSEQGVGDQMRFVRDLTALRPFCGGITVECAARLVPLFRRSLPAGVAVVAAAERSEGRRHVFDYGWLAAGADSGPDSRPAAYIEMGSLLLRLWQRGIAPDRR